MISENLKILRKLKGFTQSEMLDFIGITGNTKWSDYERGKSMPPIDILLKISDKFQMQLDFLVKEDLTQVRFEDKITLTKNDEKGKVLGKKVGKVYNFEEDIGQLLEEPREVYNTTATTIASLNELIGLQRQEIARLNKENSQLQQQLQQYIQPQKKVG